MAVDLSSLPAVPRTASLALRDAMLDIFGEGLAAAWIHGGTTFPDRPRKTGDLDVAFVLVGIAPTERSPRAWRRDPSSRPARAFAAEAAIRRDMGLAVDSVHVRAEEVGLGRLPSRAFEQGHRVNDWAVLRAHLHAGQYVLLYGRSPQELVTPPTTRELRYALARELEHLERHVLAGDAEDPYEATYAIWNGSRILRALATGDAVVSKRSAGEWALENLDPRWHRAIEAARRAYDGFDTPDDREVLRTTMAPFVAMVRERLPETGRRRRATPRWS
jgi:Domain of unknown function (DUF4111)